MLNPDLDRVVAWLVGIGLPVRIVPTADNGVLPGLRIEHGAILTSRRAFLGDLLHESGHLAILPSVWRAQAHVDVGVVMRRMDRDLARRQRAGIHADDPYMRAVINAGDNEATAWAWAAGEHLGLQGVQIIRSTHYGGQGRDIRSALKARQYPGINGLAQAGFCSPRIPARGLPVFPTLAFWLQP